MTLAGTTLFAHKDEETPGWVPVLEIRAISSAPEGSHSNVSGPRNLVKGEPIVTTITSGATLCSLGIAGDRPAAGTIGAQQRVEIER